MLRPRCNKQNFDPASLDDEIATKTSWTPVRKAAASFCTHRLRSINSERSEFNVTLEAQLFCGVFLMLGLMLTSISIVLLPTSEQVAFGANLFLAPFVGLTFTLCGGGMLYWVSTPIVFDYAAGFFWIGRQAPSSFVEQNVAKHFSRLDRIHALQLLSQYNRGNKTSYYSYQLNLILKDGNRINVLNHGDEQQVRSDATELAAFLGRPVWDEI